MNARRLFGGEGALVHTRIVVMLVLWEANGGSLLIQSGHDGLQEELSHQFGGRYEAVAV